MLDDRELTKLSYLGYIFGLSCDSFGFSFGFSCDMGYILRLSCDSFGLICDSFGFNLWVTRNITRNSRPGVQTASRYGLPDHDGARGYRRDGQ